MASNRTPNHPAYPSPHYSPQSSRTPIQRLNSDPSNFNAYQFTSSYSAEATHKLLNKREHNFSEYPKMQSFSLYDKDTKSNAKDTYNYKYLVSPVAFRKTHVSKFHANNRNPSTKTPSRKDKEIKADPFKMPASNLDYKILKLPVANLDTTNKEYSFIKELHEKFLVCKICFKSFVKPKTLNCLHSFCEECLTKHKEKDSGISNRNRLLCPVCNVKTDLPFGGIRRLPESHMISNLNQVLTNRINKEIKCVSDSESYSSKHSFNESAANSIYNFIDNEESGDKSASDSLYVKYWCGICGKANKVDGELPVNDHSNNNEINSKKQDYNLEVFKDDNVSECWKEMKKEATVECLDCSSKMLCGDCADLHRSAEITSGHSLVAIELAKKGKLQCEFHEKEMIRYFCESCDICVCVLCAFNRHKTHKIVTFAEGIESQLNQLGEKFNVCKVTSNGIKEQLGLINKFESKVYKVESLIKEQTNELMMKLKEKEQQTLDGLKLVTDEEGIVEFLDQKSKMEGLLKSVDSTFKFIENVLSGKSVDIFLVKKVLEEKMEDLLVWVTMKTPEIVKEPLNFVPSNQDIHFGKLVIKRPSIDDMNNVCENDISLGRNYQTTSKSDNDIKLTNFMISENLNEPANNSNDLNNSNKNEILCNDKKHAEIGVQTYENIDDIVKERMIIEEQIKYNLKKENVFEKGTCTEKVESFDKSLQVLIAPPSLNVAVMTDNIRREDKSTVTVSTSVSSAYKDFLENMSPKVLKINRGTMTLEENHIVSSKSAKVKLIAPKQMVHKATSPIKVIKFDKAIMANKAEVTEQKEVFHRAGLNIKPKKIINESFSGNLLDSIHEDEDEEEDDGETANNNDDTKTNDINNIMKRNSKTIGCVPKSKMVLKPLPTTKEQLIKNKTKSAVVHPMNLPLRNNLKLPSSNLVNSRATFNNQMPFINRSLFPTNNLPFTRLPNDNLPFTTAPTNHSRVHVDISTNTRSVSKEDKATGTDSPPVVEKMAECISKLKTVRHRLECLQASQNSSDSIEGSRYDNVRTDNALESAEGSGYDNIKTDSRKDENSLDNNDPPTLINSMISNQPSPDVIVNPQESSNVASQSTSDNDNNNNKTLMSPKGKRKPAKDKSSLENRPSTPCTNTMKRNTKKNMPKLKDNKDQSNSEVRSKMKGISSTSSSYNSSESSCNNSPSIQRSLKTSLHRPVSSPGSHPSNQNKPKPPFSLPKTPPTSAHRHKPPSFVDQKIKSRLTDLSDSLHSESSEDQEKSQETSSNKSDISANPAKRPTTVSKTHPLSPNRRNKNEGVLKSPKERHNSPRPLKR